MTGCTMQIHLDPSPRHFFTTGDVISGTIDLATTGMYSLTDVQVKLRCDEYAVVTVMDETVRHRRKRERRAQRTGPLAQLTRAAHEQALKQIGKAGNFDADTMQIVGDGLRMLRERRKHFQLTTNAFATPQGESKSVLGQGHHTYPFSFRLTDSVDKCPPNAPLKSVNGLKIGVFWTVKAVLRRPGVLQSDLREVITVPIYPKNRSSAILNLNEQKHVEGSTNIGLGNKVTAELRFPSAGLSQDEGHVPLNLHLSSTTKYEVRGLHLALERLCITKAKGLKEKHVNNVDLGYARVHKIIHGSTDLTPFLKSIPLRDFIAPTVNLRDLSIAYELVLRIESVRELVIRTPITVLSPAVTAPPDFFKSSSTTLNSTLTSRSKTDTSALGGDSSVDSPPYSQMFGTGITKSGRNTLVNTQPNLLPPPLPPKRPVEKDPVLDSKTTAPPPMPARPSNHPRLGTQSTSVTQSPDEPSHVLNEKSTYRHSELPADDEAGQTRDELLVIEEVSSLRINSGENESERRLPPSLEPPGYDEVVRGL